MSPFPELTTPLHTWASHSRVWHSAPRSQAAPTGSLGTQVPALQKSPAGHPASVVHVTGVPAHFCVVVSHSSLRHSPLPVHGPSPGARPHLSSAGSQTP